MPGEGAALEALAGGAGGPGALGPLLATVLDALDAGIALRSGPLPAGSPAEITALVEDGL
ncbi:aspartate aminotransferase family protein, partial [Streptomyces sp. FH025]|nr:aspartate aminotransferase family protein [Streptomyces sp. FH025]